MQQEVWNDGKHTTEFGRGNQQPRLDTAAHKPELGKQPMRMGNGDLWKDRQLRDYRRANGLCFSCGDKYDPTHKCAKRQAAEAHAIQLEKEAEYLSDEVLNLLELHDIAQAEQLSMS